MGPKPIQDVAPPAAANTATGPPSGPEIVGDIPVQAPAQQAAVAEEPVKPKDDDSSFIVPATPVSSATGKDKIKSKVSKPKPALAIIVAVAALICLAVGAYLKYFINR